MTNPNKIYLLFFIIVNFNVVYSQSLTIDKVYDELNGYWSLTKTVVIKDGDTLTQKPSVQLWKTPGAEPVTRIKFDSINKFEIEQECMKCPWLNWKGQYTVENRILNGDTLNYIDFSDNPKLEALDLKFNGFIKEFSTNRLIILDKNQKWWYYEKFTEYFDK